MAASEAASEVLRGLAQHLNCLNQDNKTTRKRSVEAIKKQTLDKGLSGGVLQEVFATLLKPLLKCLSDPMERCRETTIMVITEFIRWVPKPEEALPSLVPCLARRFGEVDILEPAEELRLSAMELLSLTVEVCGRHLAPYVTEVIRILRGAITDPFPGVRREGCRCTLTFAKCAPEHFDVRAESLVEPLMQTVTHQHWRVRASVVEAAGAVIQQGSGTRLDEVLPHLAQRQFDESPQVRRAVTAVVGEWLLHLRDRDSYFHKLIPLLLSGINDDILEIRLLAAALWKRVGSRWEKENEGDPKDETAVLPAPPGHFPPGAERPGFGCRQLVVSNLGRLIPAVGHDVTDWPVPTRVRASQLLPVLLLHAEHHSAQHLQPLLATLYRACADTDPDVVTNCLSAAKLLGTFVPPPIFLKLLLERVTAPPSSSHPWITLMVFSAVLGGCLKPLLTPHLQQIASSLTQPEVIQEHQHTLYLEQLLACVDTLLLQCESDCGAVSLQLLQVLVTVQSLATNPRLVELALKSVEALYKVQGLDSLTELYRRHMGLLLDWLSTSVNTWSNYSPQRLQLHVIVTQSGPVIGEFLHRLMPLLHNCLQPQKDPGMRMSIFMMLAKLLLDANNTLDSKGHFGEESGKFLCDILLPNLVWQAGRTSAAGRTAALSCVFALLQGGSISPGQLLSIEEKLRLQVLAALEEASQMSRVLACHSLCAMLRLIGPNLHHDALKKIYPKLLKRLDDSSEEVRSLALQTLGLWLSSLTKDYDRELWSPHLRFLFQQLILYLDDPDRSVQEKTLHVLKIGSSVHPGLLQSEVEAAMDKQRNPLYCDQLLEHIASHLTSSESKRNRQWTRYAF